uniref:Uncharacterized protein n=1 Tax=Caenorhabditis japonica TaxID=281687 RepID=A0A8R1E906_CAEJA
MNCPKSAFAFALIGAPLCGSPLKFGFANTSTSFSHFDLLLFDRSQPPVEIADTTDFRPQIAFSVPGIPSAQPSLLSLLSWLCPLSALASTYSGNFWLIAIENG